MPKIGMLVRISLVLAAAAAIAAVAVSAAGAARQGTTLSGQGSTLVGPLMTAWTQSPSQSGSPFSTAHPDILVNYTANGSGNGVAAIANHEADFGASDAPLSAFGDSASSTCTTCFQIPWALSGTAVIYNISGVTATLKMSGPVLAKIYLGQIQYWDDKAIEAINKGVNLPHTQIITVHRDSASGTTYNFTDYLSKVSSDFKNETGAGVSPNWQGSNTLAAHGSNGMDTTVHQNNGAIGYVGIDYAIPHNLQFMKIKNRFGNYIAPSLGSIASAAKAQTKPAADGSLSIVNPPKKGGFHGAYPIGTYTYVDVQKHSGANASALKTFLAWAVTSGQAKQYTKQLAFDPLPSLIVKYDKKTIAKIQQ